MIVRALSVLTFFLTISSANAKEGSGAHGTATDSGRQVDTTLDLKQQFEVMEKEFLADGANPLVAQKQLNETENKVLKLTCLGKDEVNGDIFDFPARATLDHRGGRLDLETAEGETVADYVKKLQGTLDKYRAEMDSAQNEVSTLLIQNLHTSWAQKPSIAERINTANDERIEVLKKRIHELFPLVIGLTERVARFRGFLRVAEFPFQEGFVKRHPSALQKDLHIRYQVTALREVYRSRGEGFLLEMRDELKGLPEFKLVCRQARP